MRVEVVLTEMDIAQEFTEAMEARDLPEKFFYWFPRSVAEWESLAANPELYGGLAETWGRMTGYAETLTRHFKGQIPVISFGAGDGTRDRMLMDALKNAGRECSYFPVDASQAMLERACAAADDDDFEVVGIKADISSPVHMVYAADAAEAPRVLVFSGNTMGAFDPLAQIRYVAQCMKPGDLLLVDGELFDETKTMVRRDHPAARRFLWGLLGSVGISEADGELRINAKHDDRHVGLHLNTRYFRADRDISVTVVGKAMPMERGERIGLNFQYSYTADAFRWLVREQGGLQILKEHESADGRFLTAVCSK
ncbi:MAG TPA: L-histidine N(alpha)-methyltransferase [Bryobacteraceae bacterium]|nr:L-histidine N(alpha)-methyltransferase [Bryobacteraceae bacterium]